MHLECRLPVGCALLHPGQCESDIPHGVKVDSAPGHWSADSLGLTVLFWFGIPGSNSDKWFPHYSSHWLTPE